MQRFYRIANGLIAQLRDLSRAALLVFHDLAERANEAGQCFPAVQTISRRLGLGVRQVARGIAELVAAGLVVRVAPGRRGVSTVYEVRNIDRPTISEDRRQQQLSLWEEKGDSSPAVPPVSATRTRPVQSAIFQSDIPRHTNNTQGINKTHNKTTTAEPVERPAKAADAACETVGVVVSVRREETEKAVELILGATDAPRERAEAMARDYPLQVITQKLALLEKARKKGAANRKPIISPGAWLSSALAADYRAPKVIQQVPSGALRYERPEEREARERRIRSACDPAFTQVSHEDDEQVDFKASFAELREKVTAIALKRPPTRLGCQFLGKLVTPLSERARNNLPYSHEFTNVPPADFVRVPAARISEVSGG